MKSIAFAFISIMLILCSSGGSLAKAESLRVLDVTPTSKSSEIMNSMQGKNKKCRDRLGDQGQKYVQCNGTNGVYDEIYIIEGAILFNCGAFNGCSPASAEEIAVALRNNGIIDQVIKHLDAGTNFYCNSNEIICVANADWMGQWGKTNWILMEHVAADPTKLSFD